MKSTGLGDGLHTGSEGEGGFWMPGNTLGAVKENRVPEGEEGWGGHEFEYLLSSGFLCDIPGALVNGRCV